VDLILDMETGDADDALALVLVAQTPRIQLRAVTVMPGSKWRSPRRLAPEPGRQHGVFRSYAGGTPGRPHGTMGITRGHRMRLASARPRYASRMVAIWRRSSGIRFWTTSHTIS